MTTTLTTDDLDNGMTETCPFCVIFADPSKATTKIIEMTRYDMILEPLRPVTNGHILVVPKRHVVDFAERPEIFDAVAWTAANYVRRIGYTGDWNLITSKGSAATQTIQHLLIHLVPRREDDGLRLPWST